MAYEKRTWVSGETLLSATNFNHMEDGIKAAHDILGDTDIGNTTATAEIAKMNNRIISKVFDDFKSSAKSLGVACNGGYAGKTILLIVSAQEAADIHTQSEVGMIWCGYNGNNFAYMPIKANLYSESQTTTIEITQAEGTLYIKSKYCTNGRVIMIVCD